MASSRRDGPVAVMPALANPEVPMTMGDWVGSEDNTDIDDPNLRNLTRRYTNTKTRRSFLMSLTVGHPGLTAVHTPEYCYRGSGYDQSGPIERRPAEVKSGPPAALFTTQFEKKSATGTEQFARLLDLERWPRVGGAGLAASPLPAPLVAIQAVCRRRRAERRGSGPGPGPRRFSLNAARHAAPVSVRPAGRLFRPDRPVTPRPLPPEDQSHEARSIAFTARRAADSPPHCRALSGPGRRPTRAGG